MLRTWIAPDSITSLIAPAIPRAGAGTAHDAIAIFDWDALDRILRVAGSADVLVVARGREVAAPVPRSVAALRELMARGVGLVIKRGEQHDPALARVAAAFADDLPGKVHIQLFVTPGGTHGFGWHYDLEDVFIAQTAGTKDYYFRPNTVAAAGLDFDAYRRERSPLGTARLIPGDWLYLPSRWWHMALCLEDALSISVGVMAP